MLKNSISSIVPEEAYILIMACLLHDIGMTVKKDFIFNFIDESMYLDYFKTKNKDYKDFIRDYHHIIGYNFIIKEFSQLKIINKHFAEIIAKVSINHRKTIIFKDIEDIKMNMPIDGIGKPIAVAYLSCILRIADELDCSNFRTPYLVQKFFKPDNKKGIIEFKKHLKTTYVNFEDKIIEIYGKYDNREIYYEMLSYCKKTQDMLDECQKIIRNLPLIGGRKYFLEATQISTKKIEAIGFIPKNIGFSMNTQTVFQKFMNEVLYRDPNIVIREALQNCFDTCRYKKSLNLEYTPSIIISFKDNYLQIEDNGMGMDYYIIENFFSKLGSSYYLKHDLGEELKLTAQYGVGVFSYFMICDEFVVITRMREGDLIKFKVRKDLDSYFHFHIPDSNEILDEGTIIKFKIKPEFRQKINPTHINSIIRNYLWFNEFPIIIKHEGERLELNALDYDISFIDIKNDLIQLEDYEDIKDKIVFLNYYSENEDFCEGLGIFYIDEIIPRSPFKYTNLYRNKIVICYRGFIIQTQEIDIHNYNILYNIFGIINIKKKSSLSLSRNALLDNRMVNSIIEKIKIKSTEKFIEKFVNNTNFRGILKSFFHTYHSYYGFNFNLKISEKIIEIVKKLSIFRILTIDGKYKFVFLDNLKNKKVVYLLGFLGDVRIARQIQRKLNSIILIPSHKDGIRVLVMNIIFRNYNVKYIIKRDFSYFLIDFNIKQRSVQDVSNNLIIPFNKNIFKYNIDNNRKSKDLKIIFNRYNPVINFLLEQGNREALDLLIEIFNLTSEYKKNKEKDLKRILEKIKNLWGKDFLLDQLN